MNNMQQTSFQTKTTNPALYSILFTLTAFAISANAIPPLATTMAEQFAIPYEAFGYIFMIQYLCFTCASLSGGYLQHRFGFSSRLLVAVGVIGVAVFLMAGNRLSGFLWVTVWILPLGFAGGLTETFSSIMVADFEQGNSTRLMNLSQIFYCIGAILAPQFVAILLDAHISWRIAFLIFGIFVLCIGLFFIWCTTRVPSSPSSIAQEMSPSFDAQPPAEMPLQRDPVFYLMAAILFFYVVIEISSASWIAAYFERTFQVSASTAARKLSFFWIGVIIGRTLMLVIPARFTLWPGLLGGTFGMILSSAVLAFCGSMTTATRIVLLYGIAAGPVWPITVMMSQHLRRSPRFTSGVIGIGALGASLGPLLGSLIIRHVGLSWFFPVISLSSIVLLTLILLAKYKTSV